MGGHCPSRVNATHEKNLIYFDPQTLQMTDHIFHLSISFTLRNVIFSFIHYCFDILKEHESKINLSAVLSEPLILCLRLETYI